MGEDGGATTGQAVPGFTLEPVTPERLRRLASGKPVPIGPAGLVSWPDDDRRVLSYRLESLDAAPDWWTFLLHAAVSTEGVFLGRVGCHAGPDENGEVEIGYYVCPAWRGRGVAGAVVDGFLSWLATQGARRIRATVGPDNAASRRLLERRSFRHVGEQWDDEDGLELVYVRDLAS